MTQSVNHHSEEEIKPSDKEPEVLYPKREKNQLYILLAALQQVDNIVSLLEENEWRDYIYSHLTPVHFELTRQLHIIQEQKNNGTTL